MNMIRIVLVLVGFVCSALAYTFDALNDIITELPGQDSPLRSTQFSGYLPISQTRFIHYYYIESEGNPAKDPLVFWTNGGPGCSGLLGLFTEFGPWRPTSNSTVERNPFSWTRLANIVFLEQPVGVGFSYTLEEGLIDNFNDYRAAHDNLLVVKKFFERFPERTGQDFYLASESYGGHYIPHWTLQILNDPSILKQFFRGYLVGNPFTSFASGSIAGINAMWGMQLLPYPEWQEAQVMTCDELSNDPYFMSKYLPQCFDYIDNFFNITETLNPYALDFPTCSIKAPYATHPLSQKMRKLFSASPQARKQLSNYRRAHALLSHKPTHAKRQTTRRDYSAWAMSVSVDDAIDGTVRREGKGRLQSTEDIEYNPCTQAFTVEYLNNPEVQKTLHVDSRPVPLDWNFCNDEINENWSFSDFLADTTHLYGEIFNHPNKRKDFKMLVFSGDSDGVCATVGTQHWIYNVKNAKLLSLFKPWKYDDTRYGRQQGGFLTQFTGYLSFATVHYAGHEVPAYQPQKALTLFSRYLNGTLFANYKTSSEMTGQDNNEDSGEEKKDSGSGVLIAVLVSLLVVMTCLGASYVMSPQIKKIVGPNRRGSIGVAELPTHASTSHNPML